MKSSIPTLLFAAGLGTRMGAMTKDRPKPLIEVAGRALIDHAFSQLEGQASAPIIVNLHHHQAMVRAHLDGRNVIFSDESAQLMETGGGLAKALPLLGPGPVLTVNTDAVWRGPPAAPQLRQAWRSGMGALLLLVPRARAFGHAGPGDFELVEHNRLRRAPDHIYTGIQIIDPDLCGDPPDGPFSMNLYWDRLSAQGLLFGTVYSGEWCDVGRPESLPLAKSLLND